MDMIERVARALWEDRHPDASWDDTERMSYEGHARAAILAMREPTERMVAGAHDGAKMISEPNEVALKDGHFLFTFANKAVRVEDLSRDDAKALNKLNQLVVARSMARSEIKYHAEELLKYPDDLRVEEFVMFRGLLNRLAGKP